MNVTKNVATYIQNIGINLSELSRQTGISYAAVYRSLGRKDPERVLRADELAAICSAIHKNPMDLCRIEKR